jgi:hypothetical protein
VVENSLILNFTTTIFKKKMKMSNVFGKLYIDNKIIDIKEYSVTLISLLITI